MRLSVVLRIRPVEESQRRYYVSQLNTVVNVVAYDISKELQAYTAKLGRVDPLLH